MDAHTLLDGLIRGALAGRRKRTRGALRYLTGGRNSLLNASTLLTIAGVAWGVVEAASQPGGGPAAGPAPGGTAPPPPSTPPPMPAAAGAREDVLRLVRLAISAARADGDLSLEERGRILAQAREAGVEELVVPELQSPRSLPEIVAGVTDPRLAAELYTLAFTIVRGDENVTGAERVYLARLAQHLGLDAATASRLEGEAAAGIDAAAAE